MEYKRILTQDFMCQFLIGKVQLLDAKNAELVALKDGVNSL